MKYRIITYEGFIIHQYPDGSCTALGQGPFTGIQAAKKAIREYQMNREKSFNDLSCQGYFQLAPLPQAVPCTNEMKCKKYQEEGKTPMRYNDNYASASATVAAQPSDTSVTRDYLLKRLASADYPKNRKIIELFNLDVDNSPKTYQQLIDAIKNGTYTLDPKRTAKVDEAVADHEKQDCEYYGSVFDGIIWGGPQPDKKGYTAAKEEQNKQYTAAKDTIMVGDAAAGLAALQAFEAWTPTATTTAN